MRTVIKQHNWSKWGVIAACICLIIIVTVIWLLIKDKHNLREGTAPDLSLVLDSSISSINISSIDKLALLRGFDYSKVEKAFVFINASTATGQSYTVAKDKSPELMEEIIKMLFDSNVEYTEAARTYGDKQYSFYVVLANADESELMTVFIFDNVTIRFDGQFFVASRLLDFTPINEGLRASIK